MRGSLLKILLLLILFTSLFSYHSFGKSTDIKVNLNGKQLVFKEAKPKVENGRVLVPVSIVAKEFRANVDWIAETNSVAININDKTIYFKIGNRSAFVNGIENKLDVAPFIYKGRTFVPLSFITNCFGAKTEWISKQRTVNISYSFPVTVLPPKLIPPWELTTGSAIQQK